MFAFLSFLLTAYTNIVYIFQWSFFKCITFWHPLTALRALQKFTAMFYIYMRPFMSNQVKQYLSNFFWTFNPELNSSRALFHLSFRYIPLIATPHSFIIFAHRCTNVDRLRFPSPLKTTGMAARGASVPHVMAILLLLIHVCKNVVFAWL
jgi:hypothetical protein